MAPDPKQPAAEEEEGDPALPPSSTVPVPIPEPLPEDPDPRELGTDEELDEALGWPR